MKTLLLGLLLAAGFVRAEDLSLPSDAKILELLKAKLGNQTEATFRNIRRIGERTIELENFIAGEMDPKLAPPILSDFAHWKDWILPGINDRPSGGKYIAQLKGLDYVSPEAMMVTFNFDLPLFRGDRTAKFKVTAVREAGVFTLSGETTQSEGTFARARTVMKVFPSPNPGYSWIYVNGKAQLKSWMLYEALPEKLLQREAGDRIRILLENYLKEETARRAGARPAKRS
jgi:hypothetical protein